MVGLMFGRKLGNPNEVFFLKLNRVNKQRKESPYLMYNQFRGTQKNGVGTNLQNQGNQQNVMYNPQGTQQQYFNNEQNYMMNLQNRGNQQGVMYNPQGTQQQNYMMNLQNQGNQQSVMYNSQGMQQQLNNQNNMVNQPSYPSHMIISSQNFPNQNPSSNVNNMMDSSNDNNAGNMMMSGNNYTNVRAMMMNPINLNSQQSDQPSSPIIQGTYKVVCDDSKFEKLFPSEVPKPEFEDMYLSPTLEDYTVPERRPHERKDDFSNSKILTEEAKSDVSTNETRIRTNLVNILLEATGLDFDVFVDYDELCSFKNLNDEAKNKPCSHFLGYVVNNAVQHFVEWLKKVRETVGDEYIRFFLVRFLRCCPSRLFSCRFGNPDGGVWEKFNFGKFVFVNGICYVNISPPTHRMSTLGSGLNVFPNKPEDKASHVMFRGIEVHLKEEGFFESFFYFLKEKKSRELYIQQIKRLRTLTGCPDFKFLAPRHLGQRYNMYVKEHEFSDYYGEGPVHADFIKFFAHTTPQYLEIFIDRIEECVSVNGEVNQEFLKELLERIPNRTIEYRIETKERNGENKMYFEDGKLICEIHASLYATNTFLKGRKSCPHYLFQIIRINEMKLGAVYSFHESIPKRDEYIKLWEDILGDEKGSWKFEYDLKLVYDTREKETRQKKLSIPAQLKDVWEFPLVVVNEYLKNLVKNMEKILKEFESIKNFSFPELVKKVFHKKIIQFEYNPQAKPKYHSADATWIEVGGDGSLIIKSVNWGYGVNYLGMENTTSAFSKIMTFDGIPLQPYIYYHKDFSYSLSCAELEKEYMKEISEATTQNWTFSFDMKDVFEKLKTNRDYTRTAFKLGDQVIKYYLKSVKEKVLELAKENRSRLLEVFHKKIIELVYNTSASVNKSVLILEKDGVMVITVKNWGYSMTSSGDNIKNLL